MTKLFKGTIAVGQRDSVPDWEPFVQPWRPPAANVLDDVGYPQCSRGTA